MLVAQGAPADHLVPTEATPTLADAVSAAADGDVIEIDASLYKGEEFPVTIGKDLEVRGVNGKARVPPLFVDQATVKLSSLWLSGTRLVTHVALADLATAVLGPADYDTWPFALYAEDAVIEGASIEISNAEGVGIRADDTRLTLDGFDAHDFPTTTALVVEDDAILVLRDGAFSNAAFGAIGADDSDVLIESVAFSNNAGVAGADLYAKGGGRLVRLVGISSVGATSATDGGSIRAEDVVLVLVDVRVEGAKAVGCGGALYAKDIDVAADGLVVVGVTAATGGGVCLQGGTLDASDVHSDDAAATDGGFLWASGATVTIDGLGARSTSGAPAGQRGGVVWIEKGRLSIADADASGVGVTGDGALVHATETEVTLTGGLVEQMQAGGAGGVVFVDDGSLTWTDGVARGCAAHDGSVVHARDDATVTLRDGWFEGNVASGKGTVHGFTGAVLNVERSLFCDNDALIGSGLAIEGGRLADNVTNTVFLGNESVDGVAGATIAVLGGALASGNDHVHVLQVDFVEEVATRAVVYADSSRVDVRNTIFFGSAPAASEDGSGPGVSGAYNLLHDPAGPPPDQGDAPGFPAGGVVMADPLFQGWSPGDCRSNLWLSPGSPARDAGDAALFDPDGSRSDIGAFGGSDADLVDGDGDGTYADLDCDDTDPTVHMSEAEIPYDGIDQDCDGSDLVDVDGDGFAGWGAGGPDCDDADAAVNPEAVEDWYDGIDQDCDGNDDDRDQDGFSAVIAGGGDCDDDDAGIHPGIPEQANDAIDQDCDGHADGTRLVGTGGFGCATAPFSGAGGLFVAIGALACSRRRRGASASTRIG